MALQLRGEEGEGSDEEVDDDGVLEREAYIYSVTIVMCHLTKEMGNLPLSITKVFCSFP
jgi:hypothetical protein